MTKTVNRRNPRVKGSRRINISVSQEDFELLQRVAKVKKRSVSGLVAILAVEFARGMDSDASNTKKRTGKLSPSDKFAIYGV